MAEIGTFLCVGILAGYILLAWKRPAIAFSTMPIATAFVVYVAVMTDTPDNLLVACALFLGTLLIVAAGGRDRENRQWFHWGAWYLLVGITAALVMGLILAGFQTGINVGGYALLVILIASVVIFVASLVYYGMSSRRVRAIDVFATLRAIMKQNLPLPMALDCAAGGKVSGTAAILRGIKGWLVKGCSLADSVRRGYPGCPSAALAMIASAEGIGQLPAALVAIEADVKSRTVGPRRLRPIHPFYPVVIIILIFFMTTGLMMFIVPQLESVFAEMCERPLPPPTRLLLHITHALARGYDGVFLLVLVACLILCRSHYLASRRRRDRGGLVLWLGDALLWGVPLVRGFEIRRARVQVLELLRFSLIAGSPVNEAIRATLTLDVNRFFRKRLQCWLDRVERGEDIARSAKVCGLGSALAWAFDRGVDTPAVLGMLEEHYRWCYLYRLNVTRFILWPVAIVLLGLMVGFIILAVFLPMVQILTATAAYIYP
ncbi:MAG: type II secretion system F family protein [Phycisphaerae bacterium]|nr:type II secretion system F family protein [Phycisphaerae bacterium]